MASSVKLKTDMSLRMIEKMALIPVYPEEANLRTLARKVGCEGLPTNAPIGEYEGMVCYADQKTKDRYLAELRELLTRIDEKKREKAVRSCAL